MALLEMEQQALKFLKPENVLLAEDVFRVWNFAPPDDQPVDCPYTWDTIRDCAEENMLGACWKLCCYTGQSFSRMLDMRGAHGSIRRGFPCFNDRFWSMGASWTVRSRRRPIYLLLDYEGNFSNLSWVDQRKRLKRYSFERALESWVTEAAFSHQLLNKPGLILNQFSHWGPSKSSGGYLAVWFDQNGHYFFIEPKNSQTAHPNRKVVTVRAFDGSDIEA